MNARVTIADRWKQKQYYESEKMTNKDRFKLMTGRGSE